MSESKGRADYLLQGDWNAICFQCGRKRKAGDLRLHWQGYYVCPDHWEARHPQDFVRTPPDRQTPPWTQPRPQGLPAQFCTPDGLSAIAGFAVAGCWITGYISPVFDPSIIYMPII